MIYTINDIKAKHFNLVLEKEVDFSKVMVEVFGYKNTWFNRIFRFRRMFKKMYQPIVDLRKLDISIMEYSKDCTIKLPKKVDSLSFQCRLEMGNISENEGTPEDKIIDMVALGCYSTQHQVKFNSDGKLFKEFRQYVSDQPLIHIMGLYNYIREGLRESDELWNKLFSEMNVIDPDYEEAGGPAVLGRFSLIKTIKKVQADFSKSYEEAFLVQYSLVQMNNLQSASESWLQHRMTQIKERKFKNQRQSNG
tara:strand:- start:1357 stop:2106 length:750 start_codon:yes stop_codon:yes gene_type:complete